jgi:hypothetical protein
MVHLSVIRILRLRSASEILTAGFMGLRFLLNSGLHAADVTAAPAARDADGAAPGPLVTSEGRLAATWAGNLVAARAALASDCLCHWQPEWPQAQAGNVMPLALVSGIKEAESQLRLVKRLPYSGIVKVRVLRLTRGLGFST